MSTTRSAIKRLGAEYHALCTGTRRVREMYVAPLEDNLFEWHFTLRGPSCEGLPYDKGLYHGVLHFPPTYPFEPPDITFLTPNGRFLTHTKICTTISSFHKEAWRPSYDVMFVLTSLRLFMASDDYSGIGSISRKSMLPETRLRLAEESWDYYCVKCKCRAREIWQREMAMYPELSPSTDEAKKAAAEDDAAAAAAEEATTEAAQCATTATATSDEATTSADATPPTDDAVVAHEDDGNDKATTTTTTTTSEVTADDVQTTPATHTTAATAATTTAAVTTTTTQARVLQPVLRIHLGQRVLCVRVRSVDRAIVTCFTIVSAILLRWALVWLFAQ